LNEIAATAHLQIEVEERCIPVQEQVRGACEILGLDPLYVACEGRFVAFVPPREQAKALEILRASAVGKQACCIGKVSAAAPGLVTVKSQIGALRILDLLTGEQLPRIC
jgi:hydrogenase expression/formation protein HypE